MSKRYPGGLITKTPVTPTISAAPGIWTLDQAITYIKAGTWPTQIPSVYWIGLLGRTTGGDQIGRAIAVDAVGNVYLGGTSNLGGGDVFQIAKYNSLGTLQWQKSLGGSVGGAYSVAVDFSGNVYVCGNATLSGTIGIEIVKYSTDGTLQWQKILNSAFSDEGRGIAVDASGNVYVCGQAYVSSAVGFQIAKYNTSGNIQWQRRLGDGPSDGAVGQSVAVDSVGNVYVCGSAGYSGLGNIQIAKYNTSGVYEWQRRLNNELNVASVSGYSVATDSSGNVYICGVSIAGQSILIAKYNTYGVIQWQRSLGSATSTDNGYSVAVDSSGNVYVCGYSDRTGTRDLQIAKYDTSGTIQWQRRLGGPFEDTGQSVAVDSYGNFYVCGYTDLGSGNLIIFAKLPGDGSLTGTYTVRGYAFTYAESALTDAASSLADAVAGLTDSVSTLTDAASTYTDTATSLTSSVTVIS
jgi:uncharacterized delta-60 repeat protein